MSKIHESIDVDVPVRIAYDQWTQFETFPRFMDGVKRVQQLDDTTLEWTAEINGIERSWRADITEQAPDRVIAWRSTSGRGRRSSWTSSLMIRSRRRATRWASSSGRSRGTCAGSRSSSSRVGRRPAAGAARSMTARRSAAAVDEPRGSCKGDGSAARTTVTPSPRR